jgi:hypothetical protein
MDPLFLSTGKAARSLDVNTDAIHRSYEAVRSGRKLLLVASEEIEVDKVLLLK